MNIFLCAFGSGILAVGGMIWTVKNSTNDIKMLRSGGQNTTQALTTGGEKAKQLTDKPRAQDPMAGVATGIATGGVAGGVAAGALRKFPGGAKGAAKVAGAVGGLMVPGAKIALSAGKIGLGAVAATGEAINKATGLTRRISGFVRPIGRQIRFTASSAAGAVKNRLQAQGDRLKGRIGDVRESIVGNIPSEFKRKIKGIKSKAKLSATIAKERARYQLNEFGESIEEKRQFISSKTRQMAEGARRTREATAAALQDTWGGRLVGEGMRELRSIVGPVMLPQNLRYTLATNSGYSYSDVPAIRLTGNNIQSLVAQQRGEKEENKPKNEHYVERYREALEKANEENGKVAMTTIGNFLGKNNNFHNLIESHINQTVGKNASQKEKQGERERILNEIANDLNGDAAKDYLSKGEREKLIKAIDEKKDFNTRAAILEVKDSLVNEYRKESPEASLKEATDIVRKESEGIVEGLLQSQQSVQNNASQNANEGASNNAQINTSQQSSGNVSSGSQSNEKIVEVHKEVVEKTIVEKGGSTTVKIDTDKLKDGIAEDLKKGMTDDLKRGITEEISKSFDTKFENFVDNIDLNPRELANLKTEIQNNIMEPNRAVSDVLEKLYKDIGEGNIDQGKKSVKEALKQDGMIERMNSKIDSRIENIKKDNE